MSQPFVSDDVVDLLPAIDTAGTWDTPNTAWAAPVKGYYVIAWSIVATVDPTPATPTTFNFLSDESDGGWGSSIVIQIIGPDGVQSPLPTAEISIANVGTPNLPLSATLTGSDFVVFLATNNSNNLDDTANHFNQIVDQLNLVGNGAGFFASLSNADSSTQFYNVAHGPDNFTNGTDAITLFSPPVVVGGGVVPDFESIGVCFGPGAANVIVSDQFVQVSGCAVLLMDPSGNAGFQEIQLRAYLDNGFTGQILVLPFGNDEGTWMRAWLLKLVP